MDSLKIVSDINDRITKLENNVTKTSKSASVAFSYLYGKIEKVDDCISSCDTINTKMSTISSDVEKSNLYSYSYFTSLKSNIAEITLNTNLVQTSLNDEIEKINKRFDNIEKQVENLNKRLDDIIECPRNYILMEVEPTALGKFFYRLFNKKKIQKEIEERDRIAKEKEAEIERKRIEEELKKEKQREKEKMDKQKKIKELLQK